MNKTPVIAIFDVGKTNKKLFLFNEEYQIVYEKTARFTETTDEDGDTCENLESLRLSIFDSLSEIYRNEEFTIKAINFSTYGASFVYIDEEGEPLTPLYNYLKVYPEQLLKQFYDTYGGEQAFAMQAASPVLGSLNSGMQVYRIKKEKPELFQKIRYALHLPQYLSFLLTNVPCSDLTSIGCHTNLWDFQKNEYHRWVYEEGILEKLPPVFPSDKVLPSAHPGDDWKTGIGLHDSSAALIPYLVNFHEPFILISTGTWCISLNPFNQTPLTATDLENDCLCFLSYKGVPIKASRIFAGNDHELGVKRIAAYFDVSAIRYRTIEFDASIISNLKARMVKEPGEQGLKVSYFAERDMANFSSDVEAYHQLILDIATQQYHSTQFVLKGTSTKRIFVDGGFSKNAIYMNLLAASFPGMEIFAATMAQATALGAALSIHNSWNKKTIPHDLIELKYFATPTEVIL